MTSRISALVIALSACFIVAAPHSVLNADDNLLVKEGLKLFEAKKIKRAGDKFARACNLNDGEGCYWQAQLIKWHDYPPGASGVLTAYEKLLEKSCSFNFGRGCFSYAMQLNMLANYDRKRNSFLVRSCNLEFGAGCSALGVDFMEGRYGAEKNEYFAFNQFKRGCEATEPDHFACRQIAIAYLRGKGTQRNSELALVAINKAIELKPENSDNRRVFNDIVSQQ